MSSRCSICNGELNSGYRCVTCGVQHGWTTTTDTTDEIMYVQTECPDCKALRAERDELRKRVEDLTRYLNAYQVGVNKIDDYLEYSYSMDGRDTRDKVLGFLDELAQALKGEEVK